MRRIICDCQRNFSVYASIMRYLSPICCYQLQVFPVYSNLVPILHTGSIVLFAHAQRKFAKVVLYRKLSNINKCGKCHASIRNSTILALSHSTNIDPVKSRILIMFYSTYTDPVKIRLFITKTRLFKYTENFISKNWKFSDKKTLILFHISAQNIDCGYSLEPKNNVYPCKSQFYYIKVGFKGVKII